MLSFPVRAPAREEDLRRGLSLRVILPEMLPEFLPHLPEILPEFLPILLPDCCRFLPDCLPGTSQPDILGDWAMRAVLPILQAVPFVLPQGQEERVCSRAIGCEGLCRVMGVALLSLPFVTLPFFCRQRILSCWYVG